MAEYEVLRRVGQTKFDEAPCVPIRITSESDRTVILLMHYSTSRLAIQLYVYPARKNLTS